MNEWDLHRSHCPELEEAKTVPVSLYEDVQFQLKTAKTDMEHFKRKWIEALERMKALPPLLPPLPMREPFE